MNKKQLRIDVKRVLQERNMTAKELSEKTGIRYGTISDMPRRSTINLEHVARIMEVLDITDIRELVHYEDK